MIPALSGRSHSQPINYRVLAKANVAGQTVGHREKALAVHFEGCGIRAAGGRKFENDRETPLVPSIDLGHEVSLGGGGRAFDKADADKVQTLVGPDQFEFAASRSAQTLVRHELAAVPAIENGLAGDVGERQPSASLGPK